MTIRLRGVIAAAATPLNADFSIDTERLIQHCRALLAEGCDGINLLGTTGEATSFSVEQRLAAMQAVARSGLPMSQFMVGTGAASLNDAVRLTREARDLDFTGALVLPPFYYKPIDNVGLLAYFDELINRVGADLRLYLYNFPQLSGVPYPLEFVLGAEEEISAAVAWPEGQLGRYDVRDRNGRRRRRLRCFSERRRHVERCRPLRLGRLHFCHCQRHRARRCCRLEVTRHRRGRASSGHRRRAARDSDALTGDRRSQAGACGEVSTPRLVARRATAAPVNFGASNAASTGSGVERYLEP